MPVAIPFSVRKMIVREKSKGSSLASISEKHHLSYSTVCRIYQRYQREGTRAMMPRFSNCGIKKLSPQQALFRRAALWLKRLHPKWGAAFIKVQLERRYHKRLPCTRSLQRCFKKAGQVRKKPTFAYEQPPLVTRIYELGQVEAQ